MKRTKSSRPVKEGEIRWVKNGGGIFYMKDGRRIKPKQIFMAKPEDIPAAFRDTIIPLDLDKEEIRRMNLAAKKPKKKVVPIVEELPAPPATLFYTIVDVEGEEGVYNVVDGEGKVINEQPLSDEAAKDLVRALTQ